MPARMRSEARSRVRLAGVRPAPLSDAFALDCSRQDLPEPATPSRQGPSVPELPACAPFPAPPAARHLRCHGFESFRALHRSRGAPCKHPPSLTQAAPSMPMRRRPAPAPITSSTRSRAAGLPTSAATPSTRPCAPLRSMREMAMQIPSSAGCPSAKSVAHLARCCATWIEHTVRPTSCRRRSSP